MHIFVYNMLVIHFLPVFKRRLMSNLINMERTLHNKVLISHET